MPDGPVARVLVDSPLPQLDQLLDYRVPERLVEAARPGLRVRVPLRTGGRLANGWIVELVDRSEYDGRLSDVEELVSTVPVLVPDVWRLARAVADRSAGTASDVLRLAIPPRYVRVERSWVQAPGDAGALPEAVPIQGYPTGRVEEALARGERVALQVDPAVRRAASGAWAGGWAVTLAEAAANVLADDRSVLIVVPDHRDHEQVEVALAGLVDPRRVLRTDARQSGGERYRSFLEATGGHARILIGNRSTVYAPAPRLGLIAVWDDGDPLHAEPLAPGVHARDAALVRQEQSGAALVFAGHSRSVETQRLVELGWLHDVPLARTARPRIVLTDHQANPEPGSARIPSTAWRQAQAAIAEGPVLVQVARPGGVPLMTCARCRERARCPACGGAIVVPADGRAVRCALCDTDASDWSCPNCAGTSLRAVTIGASRTAEELGRAFPRAKVVLADGERQVIRVGPEPALVVATRGAEPFADGGYRAVLLLDGERMLLRESLRVAEDCLRWWSNAAALAAPGAPVHLVGVSGALATSFATWRQPEWAAGELETRRLLRFPPAVRIASVTAAAERVAQALDAARAASDSVDVLGPSPVDDGLVRAIVRFDYGAGRAVAGALRAEVVLAATERRRAIAGRGPGRPPVLRVRFDDPTVP